MLRFPVTLITCFALATGCGGSTAPAETPDSEQDEASVDGDKSTAPASEAATDEPESEPEPEKEDETPSPRDTLVREGTAFILNFEKSDLGIKVKETCKKKSGDDIAKEANCYSKAMNKYPREGVLFEEKDGDWWYVRFGLVKNARVDYNRVKVEIGEPSGKKLTLTTSGPDKATRRKGTVPKELVFTVVDEYTIELADPDRGKLIFEPKLGLFGSE